jgi:hypothetical protein
MDGNTNGVDKAIANHMQMIGIRQNGLNTLRDRSKQATLLKTAVTIGKPGNLACFQCIHWLGLCCDTNKKYTRNYICPNDIVFSTIIVVNGKLCEIGGNVRPDLLNRI